jgi:hypothetical protein
MTRYSQKTIGPNVDIPVTTEFEPHRWQVAADVVKAERWDFQKQTPGLHHLSF